VERYVTVFIHGGLLAMKSGNDGNTNGDSLIPLVYSRRTRSRRLWESRSPG
jgi:hypothetical protein